MVNVIGTEVRVESIFNRYTIYIINNCYVNNCYVKSLTARKYLFIAMTPYIYIYIWRERERERSLCQRC